MNTDNFIKSIYTTFIIEDNYRYFLHNLILNKSLRCPYCYCDKFYKRKEPHRFHCSLCNSTFSAFAETILEGSKIDFRLWLICLYIYINSPNGISAKKFKTQTKVSYKTAKRIKNSIEYLFNHNKQEIILITSYSSDVIEILSKILIIKFPKRRKYGHYY